MLELFLDVDGVILDFESSFMDYIREVWLPDLPPDYQPRSWEMSDHALASLDIDEVWEAFMSSGRFNRLKLLADPASFNQLAQAYPLHLVTNLPQEQYGPRSENLEFHGLKFASLNMGGHHTFNIPNYPTKSAVIAKIRTPNRRPVFLDDHPVNCRDVAEAFPEALVFLMERPHNQNLESGPWIRVANWQAFVTRLNLE
ncbi:MAG: hypothetical protein A2508_05435 [Candidatus Lambdaproteobacteria bacterium RIFOXYD12_FULL_49_8]|uniref:Haloacid dehalogenase n=1 Tax=Candidatus Lambdaproteobacteria bacterium RIFOXYD2_FULL_50_16 TaxID=1817772 RepID=A0A1F6GEN9_9PROT|nr:MAG: hypothetical protein A2527_03200 [Candidatus Lambdaproteobacteria bacterium RIFOXYD2_FULL_50_16]OGG97790.1 MAG: hypothetical protein A2508_05435 [Candidatus Lambdaproteobacteria bacterium RIFOXYD12_FULL_49_8]